MPKFKCLVSEDIPGHEAWEETMDCQDPVAVVNRYNATLRPYEIPRVLLCSEVIGESTKHEWEKTNLVTIMNKSGVGSYDTMRCIKCGITGKRHGLGQRGVERDIQYSGDRYKECHA